MSASSKYIQEVEEDSLPCCWDPFQIDGPDFGRVHVGILGKKWTLARSDLRERMPEAGREFADAESLLS